MKKTNLNVLGDAELAKLLGETRAELRKHRFEAAGARPKDPNAKDRARRAVARILTEQRARSRSPRAAP